MPDGWENFNDGEAYQIRLNRFSSLWVFREDDGRYTVWRGWYHSDGQKLLKEKTLGEGLSLDRAIARVNGYLKMVESGRKNQ